jgi:translation initiation factor 4G
MASLDDDSIDFPQAYKAMALFMRSLSLSDSEISGLLEKIDVYGSPRITPQEKFDKALVAVDEEAKV